MLKEYTHLQCIRDVTEDGIVLFKKGEVYSITGFDYRSLLYYIEIFIDDNDMPEEFTIPVLHPDFKYLRRGKE